MVHMARLVRSGADHDAANGARAWQCPIVSPAPSLCLCLSLSVPRQPKPGSDEVGSLRESYPTSLCRSYPHMPHTTSRRAVTCCMLAGLDNRCFCAARFCYTTAAGGNLHTRDLLVQLACWRGTLGRRIHQRGAEVDSDSMLDCILLLRLHRLVLTRVVKHRQRCGWSGDVGGMGGRGDPHSTADTRHVRPCTD